MSNQRLVILLLLVAYLFSPSLFAWISNPEGAWFRPFIAWMVVILIALGMHIRYRRMQNRR